MRKIAVFLFACMLALPAFAQQTPRAKAQELRTETREAIKEIRSTATSTAAQVRDAVQKEIERRKEEFKKMMEAQREKTKKAIEKERETLHEKLKAIKDEHKKTITENIDKQLNALNEKKTAHFASALDQVEAVLGRITDRANQAEAKGSNVTAVRTAITNAKNAIAAARTAVVTQTGKTYVISVSTDTKLKDDVKKVRQALQSDLSTTFTAVKSARDAVHAAAVSLAQIEKGMKEKTATSSEETATSTSEH